MYATSFTRTCPVGVACLDEIKSDQDWHQYRGHRSIHNIPKFKVIAPTSKVSGPQINAHTHLHLMGCPHAQAEHTGINIMDTIFPIQGHSFKVKGHRTNILHLTHIYTCWVIHTPNLVEVIAILWAQLRPQHFAGGQTDGQTK